MTSIELQLCNIQSRLFKLSTQRGISSAEFIKVFMKSATEKALYSTYNRMQWAEKNNFWKKLSMKQEITSKSREKFIRGS